MNNPFTSNRTLFDKLPKPARSSQEDQSSIPSNSNLTNQRNTQQIGARGFTIPSTNAGSLNNNNQSNNAGNFNTKSLGNASNYQTTNSNSNNNKVDLNFRSQFRTNTNQDKILQNKKNFQVNFDNSISNTSMSSNLNTSTNNPNLFPSTNSYQNKVISDKQYPPYQQSQQYTQYGQSKSYQSSQNIQGSSIPSMTLPSSSSSNFNTNSNNFGSFGNSGNTNKSILNGVQKQKFTFGVGSVQDSNNRQLLYDRSKFVNREQFINSYQSPNNQNSNSSNPGQKISNIPISPIQQKSKHMLMMDDHSSSFMDIDAMGDDIEKILASSKNQEQLCKLLGIANTNPHTNDKKMQDIGANSFSNRSHQNQRSYSDHANFQNKNNYTGSSNSINFSKKQLSPEKTQNTNKNLGYQMYQGDYNPLKSINHQVFDYQSQNNLQSVPNNKINQNISYGSKNTINQSNTIIKSPNPNSVGQPIMTGTTTNPQNYSSQLQETIQNEMNKLSIRGRVRTFLSASDKIQTVKYNMEFI